MKTKVNQCWKKETTGELFNLISEVEGLFPDFANQHFECIFGGDRANCSSESLVFNLTCGIRGIGYKGVVVFDSDGRGAIFQKG
jgi:hypothetical protein